MQRTFGLFGAILLLVAAAGSGCGGGSGGSLLDGEIVFPGDPPPLTSVTFSDANGATVTAEPVYAGWVTLLVAASTPAEQVAQLVQARGGTVVEAIPRIGLYTAAVTPGQEAAFLGALRPESVVVAASPTAAIGPAGVTVVDLAFRDPAEELDCQAHHGDCVAAVAERGGGMVERVDATASWQEWAGELLQTSVAPRVARRVIQAMEAAAGRGERLVVNLSIGVCHFGSSLAVKESWCVAGERDLLLTIAQAIAAAPPAVRDNAVVVLAAGNDGVDLTEALRSVDETAPEGFRRMRVVGASEDVGRATPVFNHASARMIFAPAEGLELDVDLFIPVSGTSFAAPEVARVLDHVWREAPSLGSPQLLEALDLALAETGGRALPDDPMTRWITEAFVCRFANRARAAAGRLAVPCSTGTLAFESGTSGVARVTVDVIDLASGNRWSVAPDAGFNHRLAGVSAAGLLVRVDEPMAGGEDRIVAFPDWGRGARVDVSAPCALAASPGIRFEGVSVADAGRVYFRAAADAPGHPSGSAIPGTIFVFDPATGQCTMLDVDVTGDGMADDLNGRELAVPRTTGDALFFGEFAGAETALYRLSGSGGTAAVVSLAYDSALTVSADGSVAAFKDDAGALVALPTAGGAPIALGAATGATLISLDVGLDALGDRAAVAGMQGVGFGIWLVDLASSQARRIDIGYRFPFGPAPRFDGEGLRLAFGGFDPAAGGTQEGADLFVVDVSSGDTRNVTDTTDRAELFPVLR